MCSTSGTTAQEYLMKKGYDSSLASSMLKALAGPSSSSGANVSVREVQALGEVGLEAMAKAVQRELDAANASAPLVTLLFSAPHNGLRNARVQGRVGSTLMDVAQESTLVGEYLECACKGIAACSTCHVILAPEHAALFPPISEAEQDMLDLAADLKPTSRLGCQLTLTSEHEGLKITFPKTVVNLF